MANSPGLPAAIYLRVSTDAQSVEQQRSELERLARARGFEAVTYEDVGVSGSRASRPALDRLMEDARRGKVRAVLVWSLDRLDRNMHHIIDRIATLERHGAPVLSACESWMAEQSEIRKLLIAVLGWVAEFERARISERTKAGLARVRRHGSKSGKPIGRPPASSIMLGAAADLVSSGASVRAAARTKGLKESTLRRFLATRRGQPSQARPSPDAAPKTPHGLSAPGHDKSRA